MLADRPGLCGRESQIYRCPIKRLGRLRFVFGALKAWFGPRWLRTKSLPVFYGSNKRLDHLGSIVVAVELIKLRQPEIVAGVVGVRAAVWIAAEVTEELHQDKRAVEFGVVEVLIFGDLSQGLRARRQVAAVRCTVEEIDCGRAISR